MLRWDDATHLTVRYPQSMQVFASRSQWHGVTITFDPGKVLLADSDAAYGAGDACPNHYLHHRLWLHLFGFH
jgi:hypothetical protein